MSETITVTKPKACKYCEHWLDLWSHKGKCEKAGTLFNSPEDDESGFSAVDPNDPGATVFFTTGPNFYCCHFKEKEGE